MYYSLKVTFLLLNLITYAFGQGAIGSQDTCMEQQGIPDNLSCPRTDGMLQCFNRTNLCDGMALCDDQSDEGVHNILGNLICELMVEWFIVYKIIILV